MLPVERRFRRLWHLCLALAGGDDAAPAAAAAAAAASSSTSSRQRPVQRKTVDDESTDGGDDANAPRSAPVPPEVAAAAPLAPVSAEHDLAEIMAALEADGCALIPGVLSEAAAGSLAALRLRAMFLVRLAQASPARTATTRRGGTCDLAATARVWAEQSEASCF